MHEGSYVGDQLHGAGQVVAACRAPPLYCLQWLYHHLHGRTAGKGTIHGNIAGKGSMHNNANGLRPEQSSWGTMLLAYD